MKSQDLFEFEITDEELSDEDFIDPNFINYNDLMFKPVQASISQDSIVDLIKDGQVVVSDRWEIVERWISDNFSSLNGVYSVSQQGMVLHSFTVSH